MLPRHRQFARCITQLGLVLVAGAFVLCNPSAIQAQPPGGGGGPPNAAPAFNDPKFRDRVWEAGGPRLNGLKDGKLVKGIQILGNQTVSQHEILSHMQTRMDRVYDERQLQADIHELYRTDLFKTIRFFTAPFEDGMVLRLEVVENPTVTEVVFHGNTRLEDNMLKKHTGIDVGDPANPFSVEMAQQRLLDLYHEKGMNQAAIEVREGNKVGQRRVFFDIYEGPVERIQSIRFIGNVDFSSSVLNTKIKSRDARGGLTQYIGNVANPSQIDEDEKRLETYYRSLGYFQARVDSFRDYLDGGVFCNLTFVIDEGPRFKVRNVSIIGNRYEPFTTEVLMRALTIKPGEYFNLAKMQRDQLTLRNDYYGREGFVFVNITPTPRYLDEPGQLDLIFEIEEGERIRAGDIRVHIAGDSSHTAHHVVRNRVGLKEGQYVDLRELEASERRLRFSQIFETNPALGEPPRVEVRPPDEMGYDDF